MITYSNWVFLPAVSLTYWEGISSFFQTSCSFFLMESVHILNVKNTELLETIAYCFFKVETLSQLPDIAIFMSASNYTTDCFCLLYCLQLPVTSSYCLSFLLSTTSCFLCISDCYCMLFLDSTNKWMLLSASPCFSLHLPASLDACFCLLTPVSACYKIIKLFWSILQTLYLMQS